MPKTESRDKQFSRPEGKEGNSSPLQFNDLPKSLRPFIRRGRNRVVRHQCASADAQRVKEWLSASLITLWPQSLPRIRTALQPYGRRAWLPHRGRNARSALAEPVPCIRKGRYGALGVPPTGPDDRTACLQVAVQPRVWLRRPKEALFARSRSDRDIPAWH